MRIIYSDITKEFSDLMQECMNKRAEVTCIQVTKDEMKALISHKEAPRVLSDYMGPRVAKIRAAEERISKIRKELPKASSPSERQALFDEMSNCEREINNIKTAVPTQITQSGILIRVSMRG